MDVRADRLGRIGFLAGALWVVLILVGNGLTESGAPQERTGAAALAYFERFGSGTPLLGIGLELLGFALMAVFLGRLHAALRAAEGPGGWWSGVALVGGVTTLAVKLATVSPALVGIAAWETLDAGQAQLLVQIGDAGFLLSAMTMGVFVIGVGASGLASGLLPRALAWSGIAFGLLAVLGSLRPTSLDGGPGVGGFLLGLLWIGAVSLLLAVRDSAALPAPGQPAVPASA